MQLLPRGTTRLHDDACQPTAWIASKIAYSLAVVFQVELPHGARPETATHENLHGPQAHPFLDVSPQHHLQPAAGRELDGAETMC